MTSRLRLSKEWQNLQGSQNDDSDIFLAPEDRTNFSHWRARLKGPADTPFEGGTFWLDIRIPHDYPLAPPTTTFRTRIFHPNMKMTSGEICLDILKEQWSPVWTLSALCRAVLSLMAHPAADSPLNCDAGNMVRAGDALAYASTARYYAVQMAGLAEPTEEDVVKALGPPGPKIL
eukprot:TRINITY_DN28266_c0_g1_i1.p2 TRINITY_DN28266_c0_g1~~TRINITY_DN28266_c0_g1_i1.p2  ORF type:complete len:175 (-),score=9.19 TRINITY_DN28266_c0_g1_i1:161-685(-)